MDNTYAKFSDGGYEANQNDAKADAIIADEIDAMKDIGKQPNGILAKACPDKAMNGWYACYVMPNIEEVLDSPTSICRKWLFVPEGATFYINNNFCVYEKRIYNGTIGIYMYEWRLVKNTDNAYIEDVQFKRAKTHFPEKVCDDSVTWQGWKSALKANDFRLHKTVPCFTKHSKFGTPPNF